MSIIFLDTEFTSFHQPVLLSLGMVTLEGEEFYAELDIEDPQGRLALAGASEFVRGSEVLGQWGKLPGAAMSTWSMGAAAGEWLLGQIERMLQPAAGAPAFLLVAADFPMDFELIQEALREASMWSRVRYRLRFDDISRMTGIAVAEMAAQDCFEAVTRERGLRRHHALADALALRAAYVAVREQLRGPSGNLDQPP